MTLSELLTNYKSKKILVIKPGGNFGDQLIYAGFHRIGRDIDLEYEELFYEHAAELPAGTKYDVVYVHGGGGYVPWWSGKAYKAVELAGSLASETVIVGPTTVHTDKDYVRGVLADIQSKIDPNLDFHMYARERTSFEIMKELAGDLGTIGLDHDTAVSCLPEDVLVFCKNQPNESTKRNYVFFGIRTDAEKEAATMVDSRAFLADPVFYTRNMDEWVRLHANARVIVTNRLHSSICGAVLGVPTILLPNSYHKNRSVWEMSLADRGVLWGPDVELPEESSFGKIIGRLQNLHRHKLWQRVLGRFHFGF